MDPRPPYAAAGLAAFAVWLLYVATLAPTTAFWDASEYIAAAHILGIPHPPGNPLFVLLARTWSLLLAPLGLDVAIRVNLLSAAAGAAAHGFWFLIAERALRSAVPAPRTRVLLAFPAVLVSATAFTVWSHSNVNEKVYTLSLLTVAAACWLALRWRDHGGRSRHLLLAAYLLALSVGNHLMALLAAPALVLFALLANRRAFLTPRALGASAAVAALALSVHLFLPIRAAQRPIIAEGEPRCASIASALTSIYSWGRAGCEPLSATLTREQYAKPPVGEDPTRPGEPRGPALLASQAVNYAQYLDWQWARGLGGTDPVFGGARPAVTLLFLLLAAVGARTHRRSDRQGALLVGVLIATLSVGLVAYLNFRHGFSLGRDGFPDQTLREVRERDYFFLVGFSALGLWSGVGIAAVWAAGARRLSGRFARPRLASAPILGLALLPLALNYGYASRSGDHTARDWAYNLLMSVEPYGVLFTNGDNDTFPLWYLQEVEGLRKDVTVVVTTYLGTGWYARQVRDLTRPCPPGVRPEEQPTRIACQRPLRASDLPPPLRPAAGATARPPGDSVLPLEDAEIDRIAATPFLVRDPMPFRAGELEAEIPAGTTMLPSDTFVTAIVLATAGKRPLYFAGPNAVLDKLGLAGSTVRHGVALRLHERREPPRAADGVVPARVPGYPVAGAWVDVRRTELLLEEVYLHRSGPPEALAPWPDPPSLSIPAQYLQAHAAASAGHLALGDPARARHHAEKARAWAWLLRES